MSGKWGLCDILADEKRFRDFHKRYPREWSACISNLSRLLTLLNQFGEPRSFQVGFFRSEGDNLYRIGQTGVKHAMESRLYVYINREQKIVYPMTIGTKAQQADDIRKCKAKVMNFESEDEDEQ